MLTFWGKISEYKAWEVVFFHMYRSFKDGLTLFNLDINGDWYKGDHKPSVSFNFIVLNCMIIEFNIYDTRHEEDIAPLEQANV